MFGVYDRTRYSGGVEMSLIGPFSVGFPVNFKSGGDTTRDAFGQHIEEIKRIYGILNALDAGKVSASDVSGLSSSVSDINTALTNHINSTNPHPNYNPSWSDLTGTKPNLADFGGNLDASRINNFPSSSTQGSGIIAGTLSNTNYAEFGTGLIIQWGICALNLGNTETNVSFVKEFPTECSLVVGNTSSSNNSIDPAVTINSWSKKGFQAVSHGDAYYGSGITYAYIAIGF